MERNLREKLPGGIFGNVDPIRSRTMSAIRGKNAKSTERTLQMALIRGRVRGWKRHVADLPGKPDFYFPEARLAVFVDGCFWHACPRCGHVPRTNNAFWAEKMRRNTQRDSSNRRKLQRRRIKCIRIWEHALKTPKQIESAVSRVRDAVTKMALVQPSQRSSEFA